MRVFHVISGLGKAAGTTVFVVNLCNYLLEQKVESIIFVTQKSSNAENPVKGISVYEGLSYLQVLPRPDIVHIHALWAPFLHDAMRWTKAHKIPVVWSPHGMLTPWALSHKKLKKWIAMVCYQYRDLKHASLFHATAQSEVDDLRRIKLQQRACVAPLGVDVPTEAEIQKVSHMRRQNGKRTVLFISRVHPKKGLFHLVDAWVQLKQIKDKQTEERLTDGWQVVIAGPSEANHANEVMVHIQRKDITEDFQMHGAVYGNAKDELYKTADIFVLPSFSENFGSVVIEALAWGCPVITTKGTPWKELETCQCGKWIDIGVEPLIVALKEMMILSDIERQEMGENGRKLVERQYTWGKIAETMRKAYADLLEGKV